MPCLVPHFCPLLTFLSQRRKWLCFQQSALVAGYHFHTTWSLPIESQNHLIGKRPAIGNVLTIVLPLLHTLSFLTQGFFQAELYFLTCPTVFPSCLSCPYHSTKGKKNAPTQILWYIAEFLSHCTGEAGFPINIYSWLGKCQQTLW